MALIGIAILLCLFFFWTLMLARVHGELKRTARRELPMTLTFYTFGIAGALMMLGRKGKSEVLAAWANELLGGAPEGGDEETAAGEPEEGTLTIHSASLTGRELEPGAQEQPAEGALATAQAIIKEAIKETATDIHLEPEPGQLKVRYRIDGMLQSPKLYGAEMAGPVVSAIKVMAAMDVAEKRRAQDGSFSASFEGRPIDFRVSTAGTSHGEKMVIRILDRAVGLRKLQDLGLSEAAYQEVRSIVNSAYGMLIACGPAGCGKTTTLYAALQEVDRSALSVMTIEDPIEYQLENVTQHSVNERAGITFPGLLRSGLRQDPDILMVGEIRDQETAEIAMQAAMTGHFVYTTAHANDTISALFRLINLGVQPYLVASSVTAILAQRLVRKLCKACRKARKPTPADLREFEAAGFDPSKVTVLYEGKGGCWACRGTGYRGRIGVFELLRLNDELRSLVQRSPTIGELKQAAQKTGHTTLRQDALLKAAMGITSMQEALRVT